MKANEFRIGNIVFDSIGNEFMKITGLSDTRIEADFIAGPSDERNERFAKGGKFQIARIPLTPEILEKCGFERYVGEIYYLYIKMKSFDGKHDFNGLFVSFKDEVTIYLSFDDDYYDVYFLGEHLHELQNIIFALTGKELEVKL